MVGVLDRLPAGARGRPGSAAPSGGPAGAAGTPS